MQKQFDFLNKSDISNANSGIFKQILSTYFKAFLMEILNIVTKFQNSDIFEHFTILLTCCLLTSAHVVSVNT